MAAEYTEMIVQGSEQVLRGFTSGVLAASDYADDALVYAPDESISSESVMEDLANWLHLHRHVAHLVVEKELAAKLQRYLGDADDKLGLGLKRVRPVTAARFRFEYTAYNRETSGRLKELFDQAKRRLTMSDDYSPTESIDESARGPEAYTPAHNYQCQASGRLSGNFADVLAVHRQCRQESVVDQGHIHLEHPPTA